MVRVTRQTMRDKSGRFTRPIPLTASVAGESGEEESDCSFMSLASASSATSATRGRSRKRAKTPSSKMPAPKRKPQAPYPSGDEEAVLDPSVAPRQTRAKLTLPNPENLRKEMGALPTTEVEARIKECLDTVEKVADTSGHLKGSYVRTLRMAARTVQTAGEELASRSCVATNVERLERKCRSAFLTLQPHSRLVKGGTRCSPTEGGITDLGSLADVR